MIETEALKQFRDGERPRVLVLDEIPVSRMTGRRHYARSFLHAADIVVVDGRVVKDRRIPEIDRDSMYGLPPTAELLERAFVLTPEVSREQVALMKEWAEASAAAMIHGESSR